MKDVGRYIHYLDPSVSRITILPTEKCNLRCVYCYESHNKGAMTPAIKAAVGNFLERNIVGKRKLFLSWFGGEPLLERDTVIEITQSCFNACLSSGVQLETEITTNGIFVDASLLSVLAQFGKVAFQITLDGPPEFHDRRRLSPSGAPNFELIIAAIKAIVGFDADFMVLVRIHYDAKTASAIPEFAKTVRSWIGDKGKVFVRPLSNLGGQIGDEIVLTDRGCNEQVDEQVRKLGIENLSLEDQVCYAALPNSLVIRSDGRVSKCTVALESPLNDVGRISPEGTLVLNERFEGWMQGWYQDDVDALKCPYSKIAVRQSKPS